eukprot:1375345-Rhodomonas_salina.4
MLRLDDLEFKNCSKHHLLFENNGARTGEHKEVEERNRKNHVLRCAFAQKAKNTVRATKCAAIKIDAGISTRYHAFPLQKG